MPLLFTENWGVFARSLTDVFPAARREDLVVATTGRSCHAYQYLCADDFRHSRRDRLLLLVALAEALLTLLGAAAEKIGFDRLLKVNTAKKRTHSLFRQGSYWYGAIPAMRESRLRELMTAFADAIAQHKVLCEIFGVI